MFNIRAKLQNRILSYFFLNEEEHVYINELARLIESDPKNVYRTLVRLEGEGILTSEFKGKERYFFCQRSNPLYRNYREVFLKTAGLEASLKDRLRKISGLKEAFLFGSYAKKKFGPKSDIDILLVGEHDPLDAEKILFRIQKESGREMNTIHMKTGELEERKKHGDQLIKNIFSGKVIKLL